MTRSQKYLHLTWAPIAGKNHRYAAASDFWNNILASKYVKRRAPDYSTRKRLPPSPRAGVANVVFSFSDLKYFFECPYQFKLRILYGSTHRSTRRSAAASHCTTRWPRCTPALRGDVADASRGATSGRTTPARALRLSRAPAAARSSRLNASSGTT
jgi:hypothetical protein